MKTKVKGLYETYKTKTATGMPVGEVDKYSTYDLESAYTARASVVKFQACAGENGWYSRIWTNKEPLTYRCC